MKRRAFRGRGRWAWCRRAVLTVVGAVLLVLLAHPLAGANSDLFQNIGPAPSGGRAMKDAYPLGRYSLDHHFDAVQAGLLKGVDVSGIPPTIAWMLANVIWTITAFLAQCVITLFEFAFSLDLLGGAGGALEPVSRAVRSIYQTTFGAPWLALGVLLAGLWAIYQALVRRRFAQTAGSLALSVVLVVTALAFVSQPERTIGSAAQWSNRMSLAFLSLTTNGSVTNADDARRVASDQLFVLLVHQPWTVLQFGGLEHCTKHPTGDDPESVAVRPLSTDPGRDARLSAELRRTGEVRGDHKTCIHNERKYAARFLRFSPGTDERKKQYEAVRDGNKDKLDDSDPAKRDEDYRLSAADKPAAEAMGKGGQYSRLLLALVIFASQIGALLLVGALSIGVILAQVLVLLLLAFAPVVLVLAVFPGRGHAVFLGWLTRLARFLLLKAIYSLILAVLLAVVAALQGATSSLGWLMSFGLQSVFFWAVFLFRHQLVGQLTAATTGQTSDPDRGAVRMVGLYAAARATRNVVTRRNAPTSAPTGAGQGSAASDHRDAPPAPANTNTEPPGSDDRTTPSAPVAQPSPSASTAAPDEPGAPSPEQAAGPATPPNLGPADARSAATATDPEGPQAPPNAPTDSTAGPRRSADASDAETRPAPTGPHGEHPRATTPPARRTAERSDDDHHAASPPEVDPPTKPTTPDASRTPPVSASTRPEPSPLARDLESEDRHVARDQRAAEPLSPRRPVAPESRDTRERGTLPPPSAADGPASPPEADV